MYKEYNFNKPAEDVYRNLKSVITGSKEAPAELKDNLKWDDAVKSASINYSGVKGGFEITGLNPCLLKIKMAIGLPASMFIKESKIAENIEQLCSQL